MLSTSSKITNLTTLVWLVARARAAWLASLAWLAFQQGEFSLPLSFNQGQGVLLSLIDCVLFFRSVSLIESESEKEHSHQDETDNRVFVHLLSLRFFLADLLLKGLEFCLGTLNPLLHLGNQS